MGLNAKVAKVLPLPAFQGLAVGLILTFAGFVFSQGIRKNYTEMTADEKAALVSAFHTVGDAATMTVGDPIHGLLRDLADFHQYNFNANIGGIHFAELESQNNFHAWHRYASFELEQAMQTLNPHVTLPYWDWTVNNTKTDPLWDETFLGGFDSSWSLNRSKFPGPQLPTQVEVNLSQNEMTFWTGSLSTSGDTRGGYSNKIENGIHSPPHYWVGGIMVGGGSPLDPAFWLHHNNFDRLWQLWEDKELAIKSSHTRPSMARYDGTYIRGDGTLLPMKPPNEITDSRSLGVFYAGSQLAVLDKYTVNNLTRNPEQFTYQYLIQAKDFFIVPAGKSCAFRSATGIELQNGFSVESGGSFSADVIATGPLLAKYAIEEPRMQDPQSPRKPYVNGFHSRVLNGGQRLGIDFSSWLAKSSRINAEVWDMQGKRAKLDLLSIEGTYMLHGLVFNLKNVKTRGVHAFKVAVGDKKFSGKLFLSGQE